MRRDWRSFWSQKHDPHYGDSRPELAENHGRELGILIGDPTGKRLLEFECGAGTLYPIVGFDRSSSYRGAGCSQWMLDAFRTAHPQAETVC